MSRAKIRHLRVSQRRGGHCHSQPCQLRQLANGVWDSAAQLVDGEIPADAVERFNQRAKEGVLVEEEDMQESVRVML